MKFQAEKQKYKGLGWGKSQNPQQAFKNTIRIKTHRQAEHWKSNMYHKGNPAAEQRETGWFIYCRANERTVQVNRGRNIKTAELDAQTTALTEWMNEKMDEQMESQTRDKHWQYELLKVAVSMRSHMHLSWLSAGMAAIQLV